MKIKFLSKGGGGRGDGRREGRGNGNFNKMLSEKKMAYIRVATLAKMESLIIKIKNRAFEVLP